MVDKEQDQYFQQIVTRQFDKWDLKSGEQIMVSPLEVNFGDVFFMETQNETLTIKNKGQVRDDECFFHESQTRYIFLHRAENFR